MTLLVFLPSLVTPGALADEFTSPAEYCFRRRFTPGAFAKSCHSWSFAQLLLEILPANS